MTAPNKKFTILAGPNGSGKTTFVQDIFPLENKFINADHFAQALNPEDVEKVAIPAGKQFLAKVDSLVKSDDSFIIETTLSGKTLLKKVQTAKENGFITRLVYLWITSPELCDFRVKGRVASGGHNIPIGVINRRYQRSLQNFSKYLEVIDECSVYLADGTPSLLFRKTLEKGEEVIHPQLYKSFLQSLD